MASESYSQDISAKLRQVLATNVQLQTQMKTLDYKNAVALLHDDGVFEGFLFSNTGMDLTVSKTGTYVLKSESVALFQGSKVTVLDTENILTVNPGDSSNPRIDVIFLNKEGVFLNQGEAAATPVEPTVTDGLKLCSISVPAGETDGSGLVLTDARVFVETSNVVKSVDGRTGVITLNDLYGSKGKEHEHNNKMELDEISNSGSGIIISETERAKLSGIDDSANNYSHPTTHPPSIIVQDSSNRFVTDLEIATWNGKEPAFTKNTGFNKDLGTTAGTVSEGNHTHPTIGNALKIQGKDVSTTAPTDGQVLAFSSSTSKYVPTTPSSGGGTLTYEHMSTGWINTTVGTTYSNLTITYSKESGSGTEFSTSTRIFTAARGGKLRVALHGLVTHSASYSSMYIKLKKNTTEITNSESSTAQIIAGKNMGFSYEFFIELSSGDTLQWLAKSASAGGSFKKIQLTFQWVA